MWFEVRRNGTFGSTPDHHRGWFPSTSPTAALLGWTRDGAPVARVRRNFGCDPQKGRSRVVSLRDDAEPLRVSGGRFAKIA